jgi:asparagine synthase (glutamine-hydrolysing)
MCAINGFTGEDAALLAAMNAATAHRGPDGSGAFVGDGVSLGHNRLAILDLRPEAGQPMSTPDGRFTIVFNGEIYNFADLKAELSGYVFRTTGDTEVVLAALATWGEAALPKLSGMFALALLDRRDGSLLLARDRAGVKPLYYSRDGGRLIFSSEMKAILAAGVPRTIDRDALDAYLRLGYVPGTDTMLASVKKLAPGHRLRWRAGVAEISRFAPDAPAPVDRPFAESARAVEAAVDAAVRRELVADRPVGIYLSGGIDSSVVLDAASRVHPGISTFSVGFELDADEEPDRFNADAALAERTAKIYGAAHQTFYVGAGEVLPALALAARHLDEPVSNPTVAPMALLAARVKSTGVAVALVGDGGDELFGGYERYRWSARADLYQKLPGAARRALALGVPALAKLDDAPGVGRYARFHFIKEPLVREVSGEAYRGGEGFRASFAERFLSGADAENGDFGRAFMSADRRSWLVDEALLRGDKMSMSHGLEIRVPLLDDLVADEADRTPTAHKVGIFGTKRVLKEAFRSRLPSFLLSQQKRGWFSPGAKWLRRGPVADLARAALLPGFHAPTDPLFDWPAVSRMLEAHVSKERYLFPSLWGLLAFRLWAREFDARL